MGIWRRLESWLSWFPWYHRQARDTDLDRELRDHLELEADEQRAAGLSPEEAAFAAHRALGNTLRIEEDVRAAWGFQWLETLAQDMRYGVRTLRKSSGFAAIAILTIWRQTFVVQAHFYASFLDDGVATGPCLATTMTWTKE